MATNKGYNQIRTLGMTGKKWEFFVAAINLFATKGYANVSVNEIAASLGASASGMYNHFSSKDELLLKIYEFFLVNYEAAMPNLDELLALIPCRPPKEIFAKLIASFNEDTKQELPKVMSIIIEERNRDQRAAALVDRVFMETPRHYIKTILTAMVKQKVIKPLDINSIAILFSCLDFYVCYVNDEKMSLSKKEWVKCRDQLLKTVELVER